MLILPVPRWFLPDAPIFVRRVAFGVSIGVIGFFVGWLLIELRI